MLAVILMAGSWHLNVLAKGFEYNELCSVVGGESPRLTGTIRVTFGKPLHLSGLRFPFLYQVYIEPDDP